LRARCRRRSIGYFIEAVLPLCLFAKAPVELHLTGVTNHPSDVSVDLLRAALPPLLQACGVDTAGFAIRTRRRGFQPEGGGLVEFRCPNVRELTPMNLCDEGTLKRVRGTAVTAKVSPQVANRLTQSSRYASAASWARGAALCVCRVSSGVREQGGVERSAARRVRVL
jgi:RNA 3'-terminal phosphate cyclase-like protein